MNSNQSLEKLFDMVDETMEISNLVFRTKMQIALAYLALQGRLP
jgi:hypothetical protein